MRCFLMAQTKFKCNKAKIACKEVCRPKKKGGLGIKSLKGANQVSCLKLIWRIVSSQPTLWVRWIKHYQIQQGFFWYVKENSNTRSWMWKNLLKYRGEASEFHKIEVRNGDTTSFWFDKWSSLGRVYDNTDQN